MIPRKLPTSRSFTRTGSVKATSSQIRTPVVFEVEGSGYHAWFARSEPSGSRALRPGAAPVPALRIAELALTARARTTTPRRALCVPSDALVPIRPVMLAAPERKLLLEKPRQADTANDNASPDQAKKRSLLRVVLHDLFYLAVLAATLAGVYYIGRMNAFHNVIIVPEPWNRLSVLT